MESGRCDATLVVEYLLMSLAVTWYDDVINGAGHGRAVTSPDTAAAGNRLVPCHISLVLGEGGVVGIQ